MPHKKGSLNRSQAGNDKLERRNNIKSKIKLKIYIYK
jgi:hypothetical protein